MSAVALDTETTGFKSNPKTGRPDVIELSTLEFDSIIKIQNLLDGVLTEAHKELNSKCSLADTKMLNKVALECSELTYLIDKRKQQRFNMSVAQKGGNNE